MLTLFDINTERPQTTCHLLSTSPPTLPPPATPSSPSHKLLHHEGQSTANYHLYSHKKVLPRIIITGIMLLLSTFASPSELHHHHHHHHTSATCITTDITSTVTATCSIFTICLITVTKFILYTSTVCFTVNWVSLT